MTRGALAIALVVAVGCDSVEQDPNSLINQPRLLAVRATPPVIGPNQVGELDALVIDHRGVETTDAVIWRACDPWAFLLDPDVDCDETTGLPLDGTVSAVQILARFEPPAGAGVPPVPPGTTEPDACPEPTAQVALPILAETVVDGERLIALKDVVLALPTPTVPNPRVGSLVLDGVADPSEFERGRDYEVLVVPEMSTPPDACGRSAAQVSINLYSTAGRFGDDDVVIAELTTWTAPTAGDATVWLVATDANGGVDWRSYELIGR